jgi:hypothetical protein
MTSQSTESPLAKVIGFGASLITILLVSGRVTDPVNVTKLFALGVVSTFALAIVFNHRSEIFFGENKILVGLTTVFLGTALLSVVFTNSPISQAIYGSYGRNNGILTYLFLSILLLSASFLRKPSSFVTIIKGLIFAGVINLLYCSWVIFVGDFVDWSNPYGNILGTLGNPNFIGSFMGIFLTGYLAYGIGNQSPRWFKLSMVAVLPLTAFVIIDSHAIQGRIVGLGGIAMVTFFYIRSRFNSLVTGLYLFLMSVLGAFAVLGALQIGPLTATIYKTSVSLRGQYWLAGWNTGEAHPFTGVGMDAFGDWYRRSRDPHALELPGVNTVVNAAHNVPIDMFAFGGFPLLLSYLLIMALGGASLIRALIRKKDFDPILVSLASTWTGYQLQSIISINQIGLATWGWVLTGCLIAYERMTRDELQAQEKSFTKRLDSQKSRNTEPVGVLTSAFFVLAGSLLALPPLVADTKWRSAQISLSVQALEGSMERSYFNPANSMKYLSNIQALETSGFPELAYKYALEAVEWNPEAFELWKVLYLVKNSTPTDKALAVKNMRRLDPLNPDVTSVA